MSSIYVQYINSFDGQLKQATEKSIVGIGKVTTCTSSCETKYVQKLKKTNERATEKIKTLQKELKNAVMKMSKLTDKAEDKDTALIILGYEMEGVQNKLKDIIGYEFKRDVLSC